MHATVVLTEAQVAEITALWREAQQPPTPDLLIGELRRTAWNEGARLEITLKRIPTRVADAMRTAYRKASKAS